MEKIKIFVSYAHSNEDWIAKEGKFKLIPWLERQLHGRVDIWTDHALKQQIGEEYTKLIRDKIMQADISILLISQDFVSSQYITDIELPLIRQCYMVGTMKIVPLLITSLTQKGKDKISWIFDLQTYPNDTKPLINFFNHDAEWEKIKVEILEGIENKIDSIEHKPKVTVVAPPLQTEVPKTVFVQQEPSSTEQHKEKKHEPASKQVSSQPEQPKESKPAKKGNAVTIAIFATIVVVIGIAAFLFMGKTSQQSEAAIANNDSVATKIEHTETATTKSEQTSEKNQPTEKGAKTETTEPNNTKSTVNQPAVAEVASTPASKTETKPVAETPAPAKPVENTTQANPEALIAMGNSFDDKGEFDNAIASYQKALSVDPKNAKAYNCLGISYFNKNDYDNAIAAYMKSIAIDANIAKVYNNLGNVYGKKKELAKQIVCYKNAAKLGHKKAQDWLQAHNETW